MSVVTVLKSAAHSVSARVRSFFKTRQTSHPATKQMSSRQGRRRRWTQQAIVRVAKHRGLTVERDDDTDTVTIWRDFPGWKLAGMHVAADGSGMRVDVETTTGLVRMKPGEVAYFLFDDRSGLE